MKNFDEHYSSNGLNISDEESYEVLEKYYLADRTVRSIEYRRSDFFIEKADNRYIIYQFNDNLGDSSRVIHFEDGEIIEKKEIAWEEARKAIGS